LLRGIITELITARMLAKRSTQEEAAA
jgi:hypothetical protein